MRDNQHGHDLALGLGSIGRGRGELAPRDGAMDVPVVMATTAEASVRTRT